MRSASTCRTEPYTNPANASARPSGTDRCLWRSESTAKDAKSAKEKRTVQFQEPAPEIDELAHAVIGAAIEVHRILGPGFLEAIYEQALCVELRLRGIPLERQKPTKVEYKGEYVGEVRLDLLVDDRLVVELKAVREMGSS